MAYNVPIFDYSTQNKLMQQADRFAPDISPYYTMLQNQGQAALQKSFQAAQDRIGSQFGNNFRMAQQRLGGAPLLADSGYANRLNRQLQAGAFGDLANAYSGAAANQALTQQQQLAQLIQQRLGARDAYLNSALQGTTRKKNFGDYALGAVGAAASAVPSFF